MNCANRWRSRKGRIVLDVLASRLGNDWCVRVTGGDPHIGAVGWSGGGLSANSLEFPEHRDRAVVELFLEALIRVPGRHVVTAGVHLDQITQREVSDVLELCRVLAARVANALTQESA